jgi:hypothetical protein
MTEIPEFETAGEDTPSSEPVQEEVVETSADERRRSRFLRPYAQRRR